MKSFPDQGHIVISYDKADRKSFATIRVPEYDHEKKLWRSVHKRYDMWQPKRAHKQIKVKKYPHIKKLCTTKHDKYARKLIEAIRNYVPANHVLHPGREVVPEQVQPLQPQLQVVPQADVEVEAEPQVEPQLPRRSNRKRKVPQVNEGSVVVAPPNVEGNNATSIVVISPNFHQTEFHVCSSCMDTGKKCQGTFEAFLEHLVKSTAGKQWHHIGFIGEREVIQTNKRSKGSYLIDGIEGHWMHNAMLKLKVIWTEKEHYEEVEGKPLTPEEVEQYDDEDLKWVPVFNAPIKSVVEYLKGNNMKALESDTNRSKAAPLRKWNVFISEKCPILGVIGYTRDKKKLIVKRVCNLITVQDYPNPDPLLQITEKEQKLIDRFCEQHGLKDITEE